MVAAVSSPRSYWDYDYAPKQRQITESAANRRHQIWMFAQALSSPGNRGHQEDPPAHEPFDIEQWGKGPIDEAEFQQLLAKIDRIWDERLDAGTQDSWGRFCKLGPEIAVRLALAPADDEHRQRLTSYFAFGTVKNRTDWGYLERDTRHIMAGIGLPSFRVDRVETSEEIEGEPYEPALDPNEAAFAHKKAVTYLSEGLGLIFDTIDCEEAYEAAVSDMTGCIRDSIMHAYLDRLLIELQAQGDPPSTFFDAASDRLPRGVVRYVDLLKPEDICRISTDRYRYDSNGYWQEHSYSALRDTDVLLSNARKRAEERLREQERDATKRQQEEAEAAVATPEAQKEAIAAAVAREQAMRDWLASDSV